MTNLEWVLMFSMPVVAWLSFRLGRACSLIDSLIAGSGRPTDGGRS